MPLSRILTIRCCRNADGNFAHCSILGITCRKPSVRVPRQDAQLPSDPLRLEIARQVRKRPFPFVVLLRDLLRRLQSAFGWRLSAGALPCCGLEWPLSLGVSRSAEQSFLWLS